jgi:hypothetical protein
MDPFVVTHGCVGGLDVAEWCWADVVVRRRAHDRPPALDIRELPIPYSRSLRTPSPEAEVQNNLSTCPPVDQTGQVDRLVSAFSSQEETVHKLNIENAPIVEIEFRLAQGWVEAFARLDYARPPGDVPLRRWMQLIDDIARLLDGEFIHKAARLGWTALDLFGCDPEKPFARIDQQGLCWLLAGNRLIDLSESGAIIKTWTGARQTWNRKSREPGRVLPWDLKV